MQAERGEELIDGVQVEQGFRNQRIEGTPHKHRAHSRDRRTGGKCLFQNTFLDLDVKRHEVKEKCEDEFMGTLEKTAQNCGTALSPFLT